MCTDCIPAKLCNASVCYINNGKIKTQLIALEKNRPQSRRLWQKHRVGGSGGMAAEPGHTTPVALESPLILWVRGN